MVRSSHLTSEVIHFSVAHERAGLIPACYPSQGKVVYYMQLLSKLLGMGGAMERLANAPTLAQQRAAWDSAWFVRFCSSAPNWIVDVSTRAIALLCFNRFVMW